jgi:hypothetical protein
MHKRMSLSVFASLLAVPLTMLPAHGAPDQCLGGPDRQAPDGSHWYYHLDRETHHKCWYLGQQGAKVRHVATPRSERAGKPAVAETAVERPAATLAVAVVEAAQDQTPRWSDPPKPAEAFDPVSAQASNQASTPIVDGQPAVLPDTVESTAPASAPIARAAVVKPSAASSKPMLALVGAALALAAIIGRAIFRHAESPRLFGRDVLDHVAPRWDDPVTDDRAAPALVRQDRRLRDDELRRDLATAGRHEDDIEAMLRRLHRDWERVAA